jgi:shikimate kinase
MPREIVLIGPIGAGKSTQSRLLSEKLGVPQWAMDDLRGRYYAEIGFDERLATQIQEREGFAGLYRYWKPFEIHAVERLLAEHTDRVVDLGGGHSVYEDDAFFARAQRALAPYQNVVLLLPSPDLDESVRLLTERTGPCVSGGVDFHEHFVKHHSNHDLAKTVVYTKGRTPEETRDEILSRVK